MTSGEVKDDSFNFIITTYRHHEAEAREEAARLISQFTENVTVNTTQIKGLLVGESDVDPVEISRRFHNMITDDPLSIRWILRFIPIQVNCKSSVQEVEMAAISLLPKLDKRHKFRITIERRFSQLDPQQIIEAIANHIHNPVDLEKPDDILLVEILGGRAGLSIIKPGDIFSALKAKLGP